MTCKSRYENTVKIMEIHIANRPTWCWQWARLTEPVGYFDPQHLLLWCSLILSLLQRNFPGLPVLSECSQPPSGRAGHSLVPSSQTTNNRDRILYVRPHFLDHFHKEPWPVCSKQLLWEIVCEQFLAHLFIVQKYLMNDLCKRVLCFGWDR